MLWSDELKGVRDKFRTLGESVHQHMYDCWLERKFPHRAWSVLANNGFMSTIVDRGTYKGTQWSAAALSGFVYGCHDGGFTIAPVVHALLGVNVLHNHGSEKAKQKYLQDVVSGRSIMAFSVTEAKYGGTNAYKPDCTLVANSTGGQHFLTGSKYHITNAPHADLFLVWARDLSLGCMVAVLVERKACGVHVGKKLKSAGARTSPVASIDFKGVEIPPENIIRFKHATKDLTKALVGERILSAFPCISLMDLCIEKSINFVKSRRLRNGSHLDDQQYMQKRLTDMQIRRELVSTYASQTLDSFANQKETLLESSTLKICGVQSLFDTAVDALKICSSYGMQEESQLFMMLLDATSTFVGGGTEESHRMIIWNQMKRKIRKKRDLWIGQDGEAGPWESTTDPIIHAILQEAI